MNKVKFVINVVAHEGQFRCNKTEYHAHTNMCKAGLNMMIRTMAETEDPALNVYAIDPGFVSGVRPPKQTYPLKPIDGAMRILDPVIQYYNKTPLDKTWIKLKNYKPVAW